MSAPRCITGWPWLYPDRLVAVESWAELCGTILGPIGLTVATFTFLHEAGGRDAQVTPQGIEVIPGPAPEVC